MCPPSPTPGGGRGEVGRRDRERPRRDRGAATRRHHGRPGRAAKRNPHSRVLELTIRPAAPAAARITCGGRNHSPQPRPPDQSDPSKRNEATMTTPGTTPKTPCHCGHSDGQHDPVAARYCQATTSSELTRNCICRPVKATPARPSVL